ncbi:MAG: hypothetical protein HZB86_11600 [Deltaproteobacteria bacterium]|nr:hypothetical protein [Deltaproteobacteria bacterium]
MERFLSGVFVVLPVLSGSASAGELHGIESPHANPSSCPSCHTKVPSAEDAAAGRFSLRGETID